MNVIKETLWSKLQDLTGSILELVDINMSDLELEIGEVFKTRFIEGIITEKIAEEILWYQDTEEGCDSKGRKFQSATREGNKIIIKFHRRAL